MRLEDKVCLITGGAAGIGKATALKFAAKGAKVVICDVNEEVGQATAALLGPDAAFYKVNVADRAAVQAWVEAVAEKYGRVDVLVNNAGIVRDNQLVRFKDGQLVKQMPEADFDLVIAINLKGVFNCTQAVAPVMIRQGGGVILNASSVVGLDGNFGQTNYVATKAGVIGMTQVSARASWASSASGSTRSRPASPPPRSCRPCRKRSSRASWRARRWDAWGSRLTSPMPTASWHPMRRASSAARCCGWMVGWWWGRDPRNVKRET